MATHQRKTAAGAAATPGAAKDNDRLTKELKELRSKDASQAKKIEELEIKMAALKTATGQLNEADKKELDKRLHQYIREIDRCIAMLSQ
ncbi:hypothetical protein [Paraflavitalea speifideaquila]|uniref:hypothetical protein n=1 Tax=Paraflavitalea speifideaquila TaxID=3076558 RepID=UPI0028EC1EF7|nr:hypothetical protein [Paraflavitalea speifideiaquila]